jgi:hypothetical protein
MQLQERIDLLCRLGEYFQSDDASWKESKSKASLQNGWFIEEFIELAVKNIISNYLQKEALGAWIASYDSRHAVFIKKNVGLVMAGNIPLVGFHDFLCIFVSGHQQTIKPSSKDEVLIKHIVEKLTAMDSRVKEYIKFADMLKGCDAYIATGSNNSARYFEYYFNKYPSIIRRNRTSVAILSGEETSEQLSALADDVFQYFGLGCRNVTKIYVPEGYDFVPLIESLKKYKHLSDHHKYKNNYDYQLAILIINNKYYMTDGTILLTENTSVFSPISVLHYQYYKSQEPVLENLLMSEEIQCIVGKGEVPFGNAQLPKLGDYADGVDTMQFLSSI